MPEAVIVDAVRTPSDGRARARSKPRRRRSTTSRQSRSACCLERNPGLDPASVVDVMMGCAMSEGEAGLQRRAQRRASRGPAVQRSRHHREPFRACCCKPRGWPSTRSRPARATPISPAASRPSRAPATPAPFEFNHLLDGSAGSICDVYIPMGMTAENVAERGKSRASPRTSGR